MPTVSVFRDALLKRLNRNLSDEQFEDLCFEFGVELDEITSEAQMVARERGADAAQGADERVIYKIDVPANRYDLLCIEGIARALQVFLGDISMPPFQLTPPANGNMIEIKVAPSTNQIRPYVVCAVLRNVTLDQDRYASLIDLQDKLHQNICRRRTLVAIGTHDLDTLQPPFIYSAESPNDIDFVPLNQEQSFRADNLMEFYRTEPSVKHIKPYVDIIADSPVYPIIKDSKGTVLSLPPIINGHHSRITTNTKNIFIECTATDLTKAQVVLNMMVTMFSEYCEVPFSVEPVQVSYENPEQSQPYISPDLSTRQTEVELKDVNSLVGVPLSIEQVCNYCTKMQLAARTQNNGKSIIVDVPPTRSDVLHPCDVWEDVAIAYGYNNIPLRVPPTPTNAAQLPINHLTELLRGEIVASGYIECLTFGLVSRQDNYENINLKDDGKAIALSNPKSADFEIVRTSLAPGLLKCLANNKDVSVKDGLRLFEISDVAMKDSSTDVGARNERRLAAAFIGLTAGFEVVHGLVDKVFRVLGVRLHPDVYAIANAGCPSSEQYNKGYTGWQYFIEQNDSAMFLPGRGAQIQVERVENDKVLQTCVIGHLGIVHPDVLQKHDLVHPASILELNIQLFE